MTGTLIDDCFVHSGERLRHGQALHLLRERVTAIAGAEKVPLAAAAGRIAVHTVSAPFAVPGHTNAAVDGYAFAHASYDARDGARLAVAGRAAAGRPYREAHQAPVAVRVFTGAVMPPGCDTVVMQEDVTPASADGARIAIPGGLKRGANVRAAGEDIKAGDTVVRAGQVLRPQELAQLASLGLDAVACRRRLSCAILSTGDEIVRAGAGPLAEGQVYDANAPMLASIIEAAGAVPVDLGVVADDPVLLRRVIAEAAERHDVLVTSGGASRGEEDHLVAAIDALGKRHLWQLAIKPGRPISFGQIGRSVVVGLPGNPVAVLVCGLLYLRPLVRRLGGAEWAEPRRYPMRSAFEFRGRKPGRREFWRGILVDTPAGLAVDKFRRDGSGLISGLRASHGLIDIPEERGDVLAGETVDFIPYAELGVPGAA